GRDMPTIKRAFVGVPESLTQPLRCRNMCCAQRLYHGVGLFVSVFLNCPSVRSYRDEVELASIVIDQVEQADSDGFVWLRRGIEQDGVDDCLYVSSSAQPFPAPLSSADNA